MFMNLGLNWNLFYIMFVLSLLSFNKENNSLINPNQSLMNKFIGLIL